MAEYPSIVLTNSGLEMIAESQAGQNLIFTKLKIGDGSLAVGESISTLTAIKSPKLDIPIQGLSNQGNGQVRLRYLVDNSGVPANQGFFAREVGVYAKIGEAGAERLYAYTNGGNKVDWIPDKNTPLDAQIFDVFVLIGNASNVTVNINGSATYATKLDLTEHEDDENAHGEIIAAHNADNNAHAGLLRLWQPNMNYVVGDTYRPLSLSYPSWMFLECIQGGVTGATEPVWGAAGEEISDGTARWRVRDIKSGGGVGVGTVLPFLATHAQPGWLALDTGAEVSRTTYPQLWEWVQTNHPPITEAEWQAQAAVQSSVGYYSSGDGSTTFRLPRLLDYPRGGIAAEAGAWLDSQNKAHNHSVYLATDDAPLTGSGAGFGLAQNFNNPNISGGTLILNAVAIGSEGGTESRPKTIKFLFCVKAFDAPTNQGLVDITELANELAGKVSKTETGYRVRKWASGEYTPVLNTPCIVNHGLDIDPENCLCDVRLKCVVAEGGYSVGDFAIGWYTTASVSTQGTTHAPVPKLTASEIQFNTGDYTSSTTNGIGMLNKNSGAYVKATLANWRYVFRIFY